jgi:hypothetical protein
MTKPPPLPCHRCHSAIELHDLRCPICYLAIPACAELPEEQIRIQVLRCRSCGAAMEYQATVQAPACAFCGGVLKLEELIDPEEQIETCLPFKVDRAQATEAYRQWISRQGFFRPFNLASGARLETLQPLCWAGWVVDVAAVATWTADSDAEAQKAKWAPHSGEFQSDFNGLVIPATRGLSPDECWELIPTYKFGEHLSATSEPTPEAALERFEMPRSLARARITAAIERLVESRIRQGQIPGSRFRNFHSSIQLRKLMTRRVAFPAYVIAYRYRGQLFRTVISGHDANCIVGKTPRSLAKLLLLLLALALGFGALLRLAN